MSPLVLKLFFVLLAVAVPIGWGIAVNWVFRRFGLSDRRSRRAGSDDDEPTIEYYI